MTDAARPMRRPGRAPGAVNLVIALASMALILPLLLNAGSAAPPAAAEFSPNADQVIRKARADQAAAVNGTGEGEAPGGDGGTEQGGTTTTTTPPPTLVIPSNEVRKCVGPPPLRQIEDPQSPPCIAFWQGDNGGATSRGVTKDSIHIVVPTPEGNTAQFTALFNFFNKRFQFYGRRLVPHFCSSSGGGSGSSDEANQTADAALAASGCGGPAPFASTFYRQNNGAYYMPAMACRHKTIVIGVYSPYDKRFLERCKPYQFQYPMEVDEQFANVGEWVCKRLAGKQARWAGGGDSSVPPRALNSLPRRFGLLLEPFTDPDPVNRRDALDPIVSRLRACGAELAEEHVIVNPVTGIFDPPSAQNAMLQLRSGNVTSVICMCNFFSFGTLQRAAETNAYGPEWLTGSFGLNDVNSSFVLGAGPNSQMQRTFGITVNPRIVKPLLNQYNVAVQEGDPSVAPDTVTTVQGRLELYRGLLLIASGIQMAGPNLTVESFRDGLRGTVFPNPITPLMAGAVDMRPDGYSLTADAAEWWYSTTAPGPFTDSTARAGTVCYIDGGRRRTLGKWPTGDAPFFQGPCDSGR